MGASICDLFRDFLTPDKMVATAMKGVKVANTSNRQIIDETCDKLS